MIYLKERIENEIVIDKSRFIGIVLPIESIDDIDELLIQIKKKYPKATHYCTAYVFGKNGEYGSANDDGEPSRTAGVPIFEVLRNNNLTNVFCCVIRYFGGIKLGAGGLIRAYSKGCSEAVKLGEYYKKVVAKSCIIEFDYSLINYMDNYFDDCIIKNKEFLDSVKYEIIFDKGNYKILDEIKHILKKWELLDEVELHVDFKKDK